MELGSFIFSDPGGRENNEDSAGERRFPGGGVFALADGLGGHADGELASRAVCDVLLSEDPPAEGGLEWLSDRFARANRAVLDLQRKLDSNMKSTGAALLIQGNSAFWCHAGDSRIHRLHDDALDFWTEDHSVAYKKYKAGEISRAQIGQDEDQNRLLRCLGSPDPRRSVPDIGPGVEIAPGDGFLLCSDGVWEYLLDGEILADFLKTESAREWGELLLLRVAERVSTDNDNLTLITVRCYGSEGE